MINILFYGNCQTKAIKETLHIPLTKYKIYDIYCWNTDIDKNTFTNIIQECDIIITQSICDNYRDVDYLSTTYIVNNLKKYSKLIIFDSCFFNYYYFDLKYTSYNNEILHIPIDYHYNNMMECFKNNKSIDYYIENYVNNKELMTNDELEIIANNSLNELKNRYHNNIQKYIILNNHDNIFNKNIYIISIYNFIKNNYKKKLLFYSMNHPTKYVIQYLCENIIKYIKKNTLNLFHDITINYNIDSLDNPKCIIYKCIQKNVNFEISKHIPLTSGKSTIQEITQLYYDTYKEIGFSL
jgi:hypothetical protein